MSDGSSTSIMTIGELIDNSFGDPKVNTVHHKQLQTVLYLLARQLKVLQRRVRVHFGPIVPEFSSSALSVTEIKLKAKNKKGKRRESKSPALTVPKKTTKELSTDKSSSSKLTSDKTSTDKSSSDKASTTLTSSDKTSTDKTSTDKTSTDKTSTDKTSTDLTSTDKTSTDKTSTDLTSTDLTSTDKTSTDKTSSDKTSTDKTSSGKTPTDKTSTDKTSTDKTSTDKTSTDKTSKDKTSTDKTSSDKTSTDKTSTDKTSKDKTSTDKTSTDKTSTDKTSTDKTSTDKTSKDKTSKDKTSKDKPSKDKTSTDKTSTDKRPSGKTATDKASIDEASTDEASTDGASTDNASIDKASTDKASTDKASTDKASRDKSSRDKSSRDKASRDKASRDEKTTEKSSLDKKVSKLTAEQAPPSSNKSDRTIETGADSRAKLKSSTTSMDADDATYEKLLIVERISDEDLKDREARGRSASRREPGPPLSFATLEQYEDLAGKVRQIKQNFGLPVEDAEFMKAFYKDATLNEAMGTIQLSARLEATEKMLNSLLHLVKDLASQTPGVLEADADDVEVILEASDTKKLAAQKSIVKQSGTPSRKSIIKKEVKLEQSTTADSPSEGEAASKTAIDEDFMPDRANFYQLQQGLLSVRNEMMSTVKGIQTHNADNINYAVRLAGQLDGKLTSALNVEDKMENLENMVGTYVEKINNLDTGLSFEMTNYQEELTQMQHDLETGLETMAEVMANSGGDPTAIAELTTLFNDLQYDLDHMSANQKELKEIQIGLSLDLTSLAKQIKLLREMKADRDKVAEALSHKAGIESLNGMVSHQQFEAVKGDYGKRIVTAYDKFNNQETIWQKHIDELIRDLSEKADEVQLESLRNEVSRFLEKFRSNLNFMMDIVAIPTAPPFPKKLERDAPCLACDAPAYLEEPGQSKLPERRPPTISAENSEAQKPKEDGDHGLCFQDHPIPHQRDPRSRVCHRWCGGSHTVVNDPLSRVPPCMIITPANRNVVKEMGTDGKMYAVADAKPRLPCSYCNIPNTSPESSEKHSD